MSNYKREVERTEELKQNYSDTFDRIKSKFDEKNITINTYNEIEGAISKGYFKGDNIPLNNISTSSMFGKMGDSINRLNREYRYADHNIGDVITFEDRIYALFVEHKTSLASYESAKLIFCEITVDDSNEYLTLSTRKIFEIPHSKLNPKPEIYSSFYIFGYDGTYIYLGYSGGLAKLNSNGEVVCQTGVSGFDNLVYYNGDLYTVYKENKFSNDKSKQESYLIKYDGESLRSSISYQSNYEYSLFNSNKALYMFRVNPENPNSSGVPTSMTLNITRVHYENSVFDWEINYRFENLLQTFSFLDKNTFNYNVSIVENDNIVIIVTQLIYLVVDIHTGRVIKKQVLPWNNQMFKSSYPFKRSYTDELLWINTNFGDTLFFNNSGDNIGFMSHKSKYNFNIYQQSLVTSSYLIRHDKGSIREYSNNLYITKLNNNLPYTVLKEGEE